MTGFDTHGEDGEKGYIRLDSPNNNDTAELKATIRKNAVMKIGYGWRDWWVNINDRVEESQAVHLDTQGFRILLFNRYSNRNVHHE